VDQKLKTPHSTTKPHSARVFDTPERGYYVFIAACLDCMWRSPAFVSLDPAEEAANDHEEESCWPAG
jgi:hypothetical protein